MVVVARAVLVTSSAAAAMLVPTIGGEVSVTTCPALAPVWMLMVTGVPAVVLNSEIPLNLVFVRTSLICRVRFETSDCIALRSVVWNVPEAPWTASSRMRCSMFATSASAPSAVWASEMPSLALRMP